MSPLQRGPSSAPPCSTGPPVPQITMSGLAAYTYLKSRPTPESKPDPLCEDDDQEAVRTFRETVLQHVTRSLQLFFSTSDCDALDCIVLSGGVAATAGLSGLIEERLGIPTVVANPFTDMSIAPAVDKCALAKDAPAMMVACGLAMRSNP